MNTTSLHGDELSKVVSDFQDMFYLSKTPEDGLLVLHFCIYVWDSEFQKDLSRIGLTSEEMKIQIVSTICMYVGTLTCVGHSLSFLNQFLQSVEL